MERVQVSISKNLYEEIKRRFLLSSNFRSIDEYVEYLLLYAVNNINSVEQQGQMNNEEEEVKERLKRLGYI